MRLKPVRLSLSLSIVALAGALSAPAALGTPMAWGPPIHVDGTNQFQDGSCPSMSMCAAIDQQGNVGASANPTNASAWKFQPLEPADPEMGVFTMQSISCASSSLCVVGDMTGNVWVSGNPTAPSPTWTESAVDPAMGALQVSCDPAATPVCAAVAGGHDVFISTNPTGGASTWKTSDADPSGSLAAVSCPTLTFCAALDSDGNAFTTTDPVDGASAHWTEASGVDPAAGGSSGFHLSCTTTFLCAAADSFGNFVSTVNPTGGKSAWSEYHVYNPPCSGPMCVGGVFPPQSMSCSTPKLCVAVDPCNTISSTDPNGGASAWTVAVFRESAHPGECVQAAVACILGSSVCMLMDTYGDVLFGVPNFGGKPVNSGPPVITGTPKPGHTLTCSPGRWSNNPARYGYQWNEDGTPLAGATANTYVVSSNDEGTTITCSVVAFYAGGFGGPALSNAVHVPVAHVKGCPAATGKIHGTTIGKLKLGMTRKQARHVYRHSSTRGFKFKEFFCLTPHGIRVGFATPKLLTLLPASHRTRLTGRVVWASTDNARYAIKQIRARATLAFAKQQLRGGYFFKLGLNFWYLAPAGGATAVLKVRDGVVQEIGIALKSLTGSHKADRELMSSFS
jgi:hypothetical protein